MKSRYHQWSKELNQVGWFIIIYNIFLYQITNIQISHKFTILIEYSYHVILKLWAMSAIDIRSKLYKVDVEVNPRVEPQGTCMYCNLNPFNPAVFSPETT